MKLLSLFILRGELLIARGAVPQVHQEGSLSTLVCCSWSRPCILCIKRECPRVNHLYSANSQEARGRLGPLPFTIHHN